MRRSKLFEYASGKAAEHMGRFRILYLGGSCIVTVFFLLKEG
jgi:hypothetical protein